MEESGHGGLTRSLLRTCQLGLERIINPRPPASHISALFVTTIWFLCHTDRSTVFSGFTRTRGPCEGGFEGANRRTTFRLKIRQRVFNIVLPTYPQKIDLTAGTKQPCPLGIRGMLRRSANSWLVHRDVGIHALDPYLIHPHPLVILRYRRHFTGVAVVTALPNHQWCIRSL